MKKNNLYNIEDYITRFFALIAVPIIIAIGVIGGFAVGLSVLYALLIIIVLWASFVLNKQHKKLMEFSNIVNSRAISDDLTGLYNRRYFEERLSEEFRRSLRYSRPMSLMLVDIDNFKSVKDYLSAHVADEVLSKTAALAKANFRNVDIAARYEGEKFVVIMPETEGSNAMIVAERFRQAYLTILKEYRSQEVPLTLSLGIAEYPSSAQTTDDLIAAADKALNYCKNKGQNQAHYFSG